MEQYTQLTFTHAWDILPGLAGIARYYQDLHKTGDYFAGLWTKDLPCWLCWQSVQSHVKWERKRAYKNCLCAPITNRLEARTRVCYVYSSAGKGRPYSHGCDGETAYICDEILHDKVLLEKAQPKNQSWFTETLANKGVWLKVDAFDDIRSDGTKLLAVEFFRDSKCSVALVLLKRKTSFSIRPRTDKRTIYRRIGLCNLRPGFFSDRFEVVTIH